MMAEDEVFPAGLPAECDEGDTEYKLHLCGLDSAHLERRATQLRFRVIEGSGECFYFLGVHDNGTVEGLSDEEFAESVTNLNKIAASLDYIVLQLSTQILAKTGKKAGHFLVREANGNYVSVTVGVVGNVDAGKSTTIGTLTRGVADDGRGRARLHVFNHKHEITSGRTSSIGHQILGFDSNGEIVNSKYDRPPSWVEIVNNSRKIVNFFDLAGHEKYLKTTIYGLTTIYPDYALVLVGANMGVSTMTKEHMSLLVTLRIPFIILVSKIDLVPPNVLEETMTALNSLVKKGAGKTPFSIRSVEDVLHAANLIKTNTIVPILQFSNVTSFNMEHLKMLLNVLPPLIDYQVHVTEPVELLVDNTYSVMGHPTIISGMLRKGVVNVGDSLSLGPFFDTSYKTVKVKSIHNKFKDVKSAKCGHYICLSLKGVLRSEIKKGMVLVAADCPESRVATREFWAFIAIQHSPTTIKIGYQPFIHVDQVRQSAQILEIIKFVDGRPPAKTEDPLQSTADCCLRTGDRAHIRVRFLHSPQYIKPQMKLIFREGRVKAAGRVLAKPVAVA